MEQHAKNKRELRTPPLIRSTHMAVPDSILKLLPNKEPIKMTFVQPGTYAPGEIPEYSFCESVFAGATGRWHIRKVNDRLFFGGGVDMKSLCGLVRPFGPEFGAVGGWDLNIKITERHLEHSCPDCVEAYRKATDR